jgi:hypothetical protein
MSKPIIHAQSSAKRFGGNPEDYEPIHAFMDSSKGAFPDNRHRALTHNSWFLLNILERIHFPNSAPMTTDGRFPIIINSENKRVSVRDIGEQHILEDFAQKFIPTAQDYLEHLPWQAWMNNGQGGHPSSHQKIAEDKDNKKIKVKTKLTFDELAEALKKDKQDLTFHKHDPVFMPKPKTDNSKVFYDGNLGGTGHPVLDSSYTKD